MNGKIQTTRSVDTTNIQGSIWPRLPKYYESYLFFKITNTPQFRKDLKDFANLVTTGAECEQHLVRINDLQEAKERKDVSADAMVPFSAVNVSFSQKGLEKVC